MIDTQKLFNHISAFENVIQIFNDYVLIKPIEEEKVSSGGIVIPDTVGVSKNSKGVIIKTGEGIYDYETGEFYPITVKAGDIVLYDSNCLIHKSDEWEGFYVISEKDILVITQ